MQTNSRKTFLSALIAWAIFLALSLWPVHAAHDPLELTLISVQTVYKAGDAVRLRLEFYNNSDKPLIIYGGLLPEFNLNMDIVRVKASEETKLSWPKRLYERKDPRQDEYVTIPPQGTYKDDFLLQDYMDEHVNLLENGQYKLTVRYSNDLEGYQKYQPFSFIKVDAWKGKVTSNAITITIQ